jgi:quercetin dioxygenase-like cupin family protein
MSRGLRATALFAVAAIAALALVSGVIAQQPVAIKRTIASKTDLVGIADREGVMAWVEIPVGGAEGKHTHPAEVFAFVLEGTISLENDGVKTNLKAGDTFHILPGKVHEGVNTGTTPAKLAAVFVAEKGKPLTTQIK